MKCLSVFLMFFLPAIYVQAQGENNIWTFGQHEAVDMSTGSPVSVGSALSTLEGSASLCDKNGKLRFYSDGVKAYNSNHKQMPNGFGLLTDMSVTQGVVIVPFVNDTNKFYLFVLHSEGNIYNRKLNYSVVDMSLDNGLGDVVLMQKNITIDDSLSEKMLVTRAPSCGFWLIVHRGTAPVFHAFKISADGLNPNPVISSTAFIGDGNFGIGEMKVSPDNQKIALANWRSRGSLASIELFHFDSTSGKLSNYMLVDSSFRYAAYGLEFSPDNKKLYAGYGEDEPRPPYPLIQYDLEQLPDFALLRSTRTILASAYNWGGMRAFRNKVYVIKTAGTSSVVGVIQQPDEKGPDCNFKDSIMIFMTPAFGLGNKVPEGIKAVSRVTDTSICTALTISGEKNYLYYTWDDGFSGQVRNISAPATHWVRSANGVCSAETIDTFRVNKKQFELQPLPDIISCRDNVATLVCSLENVNYIWSTGETSAQIKVTQTGDYWVKASQGDCIAADTVSVKLGNCELCIFTPNSFTPNADGRNDFFRPIVTCPVLNYQLKVYNRYGQEIFLSQNPALCWDGTYNGQALDLGTYFYLIKVQFDKPDGKEEMYKGDVILLR